MQNELKLVQTDDGICLIQQPIKEYETLRQSPTTFENATISPDKPNIIVTYQEVNMKLLESFNQKQIQKNLDLNYVLEKMQVKKQ